MPAMTPSRALSRRLRRCFAVRAALPAGRAPFAVGPERDGAVRPPRPAGSRPLPAGGRPPPPVPPAVRPDGGRRTEPLRGPTGEVSSWGGTQGPSLVRVSVGARTTASGTPGWRLQLCERGRPAAQRRPGVSTTTRGTSCSPCDAYY